MMFLLAFLTVSFVSLFIGIILAPFSTNKKTIDELKTNTIEILQPPNLYLKKWYREGRQYVRIMIILGTLGTLIGFTVLYFLVPTQ